MASRKNKGIPGSVWLGGTFVLFLLVIIAVVVYAPKPSYDYNTFHIEKSTCPGTNVVCYFVDFSIRGDPYTISFYNHPKDVENITVTANSLRAVLEMQKVANHTVYIAVPEDAPGQAGVAGVALARVLGSRYGIMNLNVKGAVLGKDVTCEDAGMRTLIITLEQGPGTQVSVPRANCVQILGASPDMTIAASEAFTYRLFGVIPTYVRAQNATNSTA